MLLKRIIISDIDGTIADNSHRIHYIKGMEKDWDAYEANLIHDEPIEEIITVLRALATSGFAIFLLTGRNQKSRDFTKDWLYRHNVPYARLLMRVDGDHRDDDVIKKELLDQLRYDNYEPLFAIEDRDRVVAMWRTNGVICLQPREGGF